MASYNCYLLDKDGKSVFYKDYPDLSKGELYISVSQILSMLGGNDFLIRWCLKTFGGRLDPVKAHSDFMEKVSDLGSRLHHYVECDLKGTPFPEKDLKDDMLGGIESWVDFKNNHSIELIDSEKVLHSKKYRIAGTMDLRIKLDGKLCVCDLKTGSVQNKAYIQLACYKHMLQEMGLSDGSEQLVVLGGADSQSKVADGGKMFVHTMESWFNGRVTEEDLFTRLMCLRELWKQEHITTRKFIPIIKSMDTYLEPTIERFRDAFREAKKEAKTIKTKKKKK